MKTSSKLIELTKKDIHFSKISIFAFFIPGVLTTVFFGYIENPPNLQFIWGGICSLASYSQAYLLSSKEIRNRAYFFLKSLPLNNSLLYFSKLLANLLNIFWFYLLPLTVAFFLKTVFNFPSIPSVTLMQIFVTLPLLIFFAIFFAAIYTNFNNAPVQVAINIFVFGIILLIFRSPHILLNMSVENFRYAIRLNIIIAAVIFIYIVSITFAGLGLILFSKKTIYWRLE